MKKEPINIVFSSGPVGGKTEIIKYLYRVLIDHGFQPFVIKEVATELEKTGVHPKHLTDLPGFAFQQVVSATYVKEWFSVYEEIQNLQEKNIMQGTPVILHDRGFFDQIVYCDNMDEFRKLRKTFLPLEWEERYGLVIHMQSLAVDNPDLYEKLFKKNPSRHAHETVEFARDMDQGFVKAWSRLLKCNVATIPNTGDFDQKLKEGIDVVLDYLKQTT
jgi:hypothetical protein